MGAILATKTYNLYVDEEVFLGLTGGSASESRACVITWDETRTTIISVSLYCEIRTGSTNVGANILFNGEEIIKLVSTSIAPVTDVKGTKDITGILRNGTNIINLNLWRIEPVPHEARAYYTALLTLEYTGDEPDVTPPTEQPWLEKYLPYIIVGGVGLGALTIIIWGLTRRK